MTATLPALIPRELLFGNPDRAAVSISPDGSRLMWLAPSNGALNIWISPRDNPTSAQPVTQTEHRDIRSCVWTHNTEHILYLQDENGDENFHLYTVNLATGQVTDLTPFDKVIVNVVAVRSKYPDEVVIGLNLRNSQWHDLYRINIVTGERKLLLENERFMNFTFDADLQLRFAGEMTTNGGLRIFQYLNGEWIFWRELPGTDFLTSSIIGFGTTNQTLYMRDSCDRNTSALIEIDISTNQTRVLAEDAQVDVAEVVRHPVDKHVQAVSFIYDRKHWHIIDDSIAADFTFLRNLFCDDFAITSRSRDDRYWVVCYVADDSPPKFYLYERATSSADFLFTTQRDLEDQTLAKMHSVVIKARDGLELVAYYSLPPGSDSKVKGIPDNPLALVFTPHGGPWERNYWGFHPWHQWLANRGYAALFVNFRASTGFGKAFINAGNCEWGGKIIEDQQDAIYWAINAGIADPDRVAILGGSFGGFSVLAGLTFTPDLFACGVDLVGVANLETWLEAIPEYWKPVFELLATRIGDPRTEEGRALLYRHSPINYIDQIRKPLLVVQGANDPRVRQAESDHIVQAMQAGGIPVAYAIYPDEGHGFTRPQNNKSFYALAEAFLAEHIGGRYEPIGDDFEGSSVEIHAGSTLIPDLPDRFKR